MQIEQAIDEFLNSEHSIDDCAAIWEQLADEVQNGDQDVAIEQARRVAHLRPLPPANSAMWSFVSVFTPILVRRGMLDEYPETVKRYQEVSNAGQD